ncbi:hypothetical protein CRENBAI_020344 [Crenichthys baileyi]|uniref:Uncharacterized protein n=1 Tax=Crenichthys baileyi TaxID=28760 RepID=A0AAV9R636_9TELE
MRTQQGLEGPLPGDSCGSIGSGSSCLSPGSESDGGSPVSAGMDSVVDGGLGVGGCMGGGGGSLGGTLRGVLSRYWSLESLHSTTGWADCRKSQKVSSFSGKHSAELWLQIFPLGVVSEAPHCNKVLPLLTSEKVVCDHSWQTELMNPVPPVSPTLR